MERKECEILIIGGGIGGLIPAIYLANKGFNVWLMKKGSGATDMSSGLFDVLGYINEEPVFNPIEGIEKLAKESMEHPYSLIGEKVIQELNEAVSFFKKIMAQANYEHKGELGRNIFVLTPLGTFKPTCLAPNSMYTNTLDLKGSKILFVGIRNYPHVNSVYLAKSFESFILPNLKKCVNEEIEAKATAINMYVPGIESRTATVFDIGMFLDDEECLKELARRLLKEAKDADYIFLPVVGYLKTIENWKFLVDELGVNVVELPSVIPSIAGRRLTLALESVAEKSRVILYKGCKALSVTMDGNKCTAVRVSYGKKDIEIIASAYIMATGDYIGGGLAMERDGVKEPLFGVPIKTPEGQTSLDWIKNERFPLSGHPYSFFGVKVDSTMRPLNERGEIFCNNLFVCGSILGGYDYTVEKSGFGVCTVTGLVAAKRAGEYVK